MRTELSVLLCTCPEEEAGRLATGLLKRRLVACVNACPGIVSHYWWKGAIEQSGETLLILKTRADRVDDVMAALDELHPYDTPELLELPVARSAERYAAWVSEESAPRDET